MDDPVESERPAGAGRRLPQWSGPGAAGTALARRYHDHDGRDTADKELLEHRGCLQSSKKVNLPTASGLMGWQFTLAHFFTSLILKDILHQFHMNRASNHENNYQIRIQNNYKVSSNKH